MTELIDAWRHGDSKAMDRLFDRVYHELKMLARSRMNQERRDHSWRPTELVHEVYIRLAESEACHWNTRKHFFAAAALAMRRILVDHARSEKAAKRGAGWQRAQAEFEVVEGTSRVIDILAIDSALLELEQIDSRKAKLVEIRFFSGLSLSDAAEQLGISMATAKRDWAFSKAWLFGKLRGSYEIME